MGWKMSKSFKQNVDEDPGVTRFREFLRIKTAHPNPDYKSAVKFLKKQAKRLKLHFEVQGTRAKPVVVYTWKGQKPSLPSVLLNAHMDVVPAKEENWIFKPFDAVKERGRIYARGSQDTKNTAIQYIEAIYRLRKEGFKPVRTMHITYMPDCEIGGYEGMGAFVKTDSFKKLNVGFAIDESGPGQRESFIVFNDERPHWVVEFSCRGEPGHGSLLQSNTAPEKAHIVLNELYTRRAMEAKSLTGKAMPEIYQGKMTSINLTKISGGTHESTIPDEISMTFDLRVSVDDDDQNMTSWLKDVRDKGGSGVSYKFALKEIKPQPTVLDDSNPFWVTMQKALINRGFTFATIPCPASTDARFLRAAGIPTVGFSGVRHTPVLAHSNNEYIDESVFLEGINVFYEVIKSLAALR